MKNPGELDDRRITLQPAGSPASLRPSGAGWSVAPSDRPVITVSLASADSQKPGLLERLVLRGNVKTVKVEYTLVRPRDARHVEPTDQLDVNGYHEYNDGQPITLKDGHVVFMNDKTKQAGILVHDVRVTVLSAVDETKSYNIHMEVFACIQDAPKETDEDNEDKPHAPENIGCVDIMHDPQELPDKRILLSPLNKGTPADLRPLTGKGWTVVPADKPTVLINLASPDARKPGLLRQIDVLGNVKTARVDFVTVRPRDERKIEPSDKLTPQGLTPYNGGKPVDVSKLPIEFIDDVTHKPGVMVHQVQLTFLEPVDPSKPLSPTLKVHACIQNDLEIISKSELDELLQLEKELDAEEQAQHA